MAASDELDLCEHFTKEMNAMERRHAAQMASLEGRVEGVETKLDANTATTNRVEEGMKYAIELIEVAQKGWRFGATTAKVIRKIAVWATPILALGTAIWSIVHGRPPWGTP